MISFLFLLVFGNISPEILSQQIIGRQTILQFDANHNVLKFDAPPLKQSVPMQMGQGNAAFLGGVGGVSFDQTAIPGQGLKVKSITMNYIPEKPDGQRMEILINGKQVKMQFADWLLAPITNYAESPYYSCVTLFGDLQDKELQKQLIDHDGRVINYHPAFDDRLLGIRLAYIDMLVGYPFTSDLPKNSKGEYILGPGELVPDINANREGAYHLSQHMISVSNKYLVKFRSYVISDFNQEVNFDVKNDSLTLTGNPHFFCWKYNKDQHDYDINEVANEISSRYNEEIEQIQNSEEPSGVQNFLINKLILLADKYKGNYSFYQNGTFIDLINIPAEEEKIQFLEQYKLESLFDIIIKTEAYMDADSIIYLEQYSNDMSSEPGLFESANPAVWRATVSTMRLAAFFRYVKANYPETWHPFSNQVKMLDPDPQVITPNIMYNPDSKAIEQAISNSKSK